MQFNINKKPKKSSLLTGKTTKVIVLTTVMFTFISYWRAASVVISDLGSTAYYIGGIAETFIGKSAPYFILMVMFFSLAVRAVYIESCGMFTRGGVYRVVKTALGGLFAKISVSALVFDYVLTGPISGVSAGQYLTGLINDSLFHGGINFALNRDYFSMLVAIAIVMYFWWENIKGIEESSGKAFRIFIITSIMGVILISWGVITLLTKNEPFFSHFPAFEPHLTDESYGWLKDIDWIKTIGPLTVLIAFGHSLLALSGEESLAQVNREIESPKLKNLKKAAVIIFIFSAILTPAVSFLGIMLIPDEIRLAIYKDNLIGGIAMFVMGPEWLKLMFQAFVVLVGVLILSGAVNTSIIGANGVLNRVAEDRVLTDWFRKPSRKYGTTFRILNLIAVLQIITIILSRGDIIVLGEAYAFGVIWSFTFNAFSMLVLRFKDKRPREWRVPLNLRIGNTTIPIGLSIVFIALLSVALINLFTKPIATVSGVIFTFAFFLMFVISESINRKKHRQEQKLLEEAAESDNGPALEYFNLISEDSISPETIGSELEDRILVAVRDPGNLKHLQKVIYETDTDKTDIIVFIGRVFRDKQNMLVSQDLEEDERELFSQVVNVAEKIGKPVIPLVVPTNNAFFSIVSVAHALKVREVILGLSAKYRPDVQLQQLALLWGTVQSDENQKLTIRIITEDKEFKEEF
ncbi:MAG: APC family permease [Ignavibacteriae bacterium]|nr:MAG: APC family permease [Ignavibacteriota bacterium]